jgi:cell division inhibitor SepF
VSGKVLNKMMGILGMEDEYDDLEDYEENDDQEDNNYEVLNGNKKNKIVNIHTNSSVKVVIIKPYDFEEATNICENLKNRKIVVVNTTALECKVGQRLLDFIGGACYISGGELQEVEKGIYLISPSNVEVDNSLKSELSSKGVFSFVK